MLSRRKGVIKVELYEYLSAIDQRHHYSVAEKLIVGNSYGFSRPIRTIPLGCWPERSSVKVRPVKVKGGEFLSWRRLGGSLMKDCLFLVQADPNFPTLSREKYQLIVPILFRQGVTVEQI